jgi:hypothetical protein
MDIMDPMRVDLPFVRMKLTPTQDKVASVAGAVILCTWAVLFLLAVTRRLFRHPRTLHDPEAAAAAHVGWQQTIAFDARHTRPHDATSAGA